MFQAAVYLDTWPHNEAEVEGEFKAGVITYEPDEQHRQTAIDLLAEHLITVTGCPAQLAVAIATIATNWDNLSKLHEVSIQVGDKKFASIIDAIIKAVQQ